jgi:hypothetical protein
MTDLGLCYCTVVLSVLFRATFNRPLSLFMYPVVFTRNLFPNFSQPRAGIQYFDSKLCEQKI